MHRNRLRCNLIKNFYPLKLYSQTLSYINLHVIEIDITICLVFKIPNNNNNLTSLLLYTLEGGTDNNKIYQEYEVYIVIVLLVFVPGK